MNPSNSETKPPDIIDSITTLLSQLDAYRIANPDEFENLDGWVYASTDLTISDAMTVLMSVSAGLTV